MATNLSSKGSRLEWEKSLRLSHENISTKWSRPQISVTNIEIARYLPFDMNHMVWSILLVSVVYEKGIQTTFFEFDQDNTFIRKQQRPRIAHAEYLFARPIENEPRIIKVSLSVEYLISVEYLMVNKLFIFKADQTIITFLFHLINTWRLLSL